MFFTNVNLSGNYKKLRARDLKFLVHLEKLVESFGGRFGVMSKMRDFTLNLSSQNGNLS